MDGLKDLRRHRRCRPLGKWLEAPARAAFAPGIIHGDYHLGNVMYRFDAPKLAAIVDWELTTIGDPLLDLGWLLATWPDDGASRDVTGCRLGRASRLRTNSSRATPPDDTRPLAIHWYGVLACYKLGIILEGTYARACAGKAPKATGDQLHREHHQWLLERANRWIS
jgi:aminoglycoside phosphotransferase (APT) family kinase protein